MNALVSPSTPAELGTLSTDSRGETGHRKFSEPKESRSSVETSADTTYSEHCYQVLTYHGFPSRCIHNFTFLQCNAETASKFCKVDRCPCYKNIDLQYITLNNFDLYIFPPPVIDDTHPFVQVRKQIWLFTSGLRVNKVNQK
ncbi:Sh2 Domain-Containing Adapter Protein F [Manis pentadactyla]|nr:Sh2 Domain-Containing Adapter Protein F [Manis pentadactyla]